MRIAIGGFAGLIGTALVQRLRKEGHDVVTLTRHEPIQPSDRRWDLDTLSIAPPFLDDVDAVVNLAGAPIADGRWTDERKTRILASRIDSTRVVVRAEHPRRAAGSSSMVRRSVTMVRTAMNGLTRTIPPVRDSWPRCANAGRQPQTPPLTGCG